jgi:predicted NUDIX family NTP pyrophosphohydrolase
VVNSIPKGLIADGESPLAAAKREFAEETGHRPSGKAVPLGEARQPGGKLVHVWAVEDDWDPEDLRSNQFEMEWPPRSGRRQTFPELDRAAWFDVAEARDKILKGQAVSIPALPSSSVAANGSPELSKSSVFGTKLRGSAAPISSQNRGTSSALAR